MFTSETNDPKLQLVSQNTAFTGNLLLIEAERAESTAFNLIQTLANGNVLFTVDGTGKV